MSIHRRQTSESGPVVPAVCFAFCNNAYKEALSVGKTPELCEEGSQFRQDLAQCQDCIREYVDVPDTGGDQSVVEESFEEFVTYCQGQIPEATLIETIVTRTHTVTLPNGAVTAIQYLDLRREATSTEEPINSTLSSPTGTAAIAGETSSAPPSSSPDPEPEQSSSKAWIAGAVVGPLVLLGLIAILVWWLRRRRLKQSASPPTDAVPPSPTMEKAQLHSDSISPYKYAVEVDSGQVHELDASIRPAEFPANETPAHELPEKAYKREG